MTLEEWMEEFHNKKIIDLKNELSNRYIKILNQLNIFIKDEPYTGSEFEQVMIEVGSYYKDDEMSEVELQYCKSLEDTRVSKRYYKKLSKKIDKIFRKYEKIFSM